MLWTFREIVTLTLGMLGTGLIGGIPIGVWLYRLPVPDRRPPPADEDLAAQLERAAAALRSRDHPHP